MTVQNAVRRYRFLHTFTDRHGRQRVYVRRAGLPRVAMNFPVGTPEFEIEYRSAVGVLRPPKPGARVRVPKPALAQYVYFIRGGDRVKIGYAADPEARLSDLQIGSPVNLALVLAVPGGRAFEMTLHKMFAAHRLQGEWFAAHPDIVDHIADLRRSMRP